MRRSLLLLLLCVPPTMLLLCHHGVDDDQIWLAALHAVSGWLLPWGVVPFAASLAFGVRRWMLPTGVLGMLCLWPVLRGHVRAPVGDGAPLRVASANVLMINTDYDAVIGELVAADPDVIVLQEVNPAWATALEADPRLHAWSWQQVLPLEGSFGFAVLSRVPAEVSTEDLHGVPLAVVTLDVGRPVVLLAVHTLPPRTRELARAWHAQMADLRHRKADLVVGDLNATRHHPSYRRLLTAGLRDAHAEVGRASASTWPRTAFPFPPMRLDHVLVGTGISVAAVRELPANGSDHAPVVADLRVR